MMKRLKNQRLNASGFLYSSLVTFQAFNILDFYFIYSTVWSDWMSDIIVLYPPWFRSSSKNGPKHNRTLLSSGSGACFILSGSSDRLLGQNKTHTYVFYSVQVHSYVLSVRRLLRAGHPRELQQSNNNNKLFYVHNHGTEIISL